MLKNPFYVNMTVGVPDAPIPVSFNDYEHWGEDGGLTVLFRKKMTVILWNACEQNGDDPHYCEYWLSGFDSCRGWHGPPFYKVSRPPSPAWDEGSLEHMQQMLNRAQIYKQALQNVVECYHNAVNNDDYILWDQTWDTERKWRWIQNQRTIFEFQVLGPDRRINTYKLTHPKGADIGHWTWFRHQTRNPLPEDVD